MDLNKELKSGKMRAVGFGSKMEEKKDRETVGGCRRRRVLCTVRFLGHVSCILVV